MTLALPAGATLSVTEHGITLLTLHTPLFQACLTLQGGQLLSFVPQGDRDWLYLSPLAIMQPGKAIRGGIPVCWPWFGTHPHDASAPAHGIARQASWQLEAVNREADTFHVKLSGPRWQDVAVSVEYWLGEDIKVSLNSHNQGQQVLTLSSALHSYLAVADASRAVIHGLQDAEAHDKLTDSRTRLHSDSLRFTGEVDSVVYSQHSCQLEDPAGQRRFEISRSGSASVVIWNPAADKASRLADLPDDGWHDFICVEAANAGEDCRRLAAGEVHQLVCHIRRV